MKQIILSILSQMVYSQLYARMKRHLTRDDEKSRNRLFKLYSFFFLHVCYKVGLSHKIMSLGT